MDNDQDPDLLAALGPLALGSRLRRLADALYRDVQASLADPQFHGIAPNHVPLIIGLQRGGRQGVGELGQRLGVTQPAVTRMVGALKDLGLVSLEKPPGDQRQTLVGLSETGAALAARMGEGYLQRVAASAAALYAGLDGDFLSQIAGVEAALRERPLARRIADPEAYS